MPRTKLTAEEQRQLDAFFDLLARYQNVEAQRMLPWVAVRLLVKKRGYASVTSAMMRWSEHVLAGYAMEGLTEIVRTYMFHIRHEPIPVQHMADVGRTVTMMYQAASDRRLKTDVVRILSRILQRERRLRSLASLQRVS